MESQISKSNGDRKRTKRNLRDPIHSMNPSKHERGWRGAASDACYGEQRSFELWTSAGVMWAIRGSSAVGYDEHGSLTARGKAPIV